jgi:hypothetical protein
MLVYRDQSNNTVKSVLVTYIPDKEYLMANKNDASNNTIAKMNPLFKGYLQYQDKDGNIKYVLRIVNGKVKRRYVYSASGRIAVQGTKLKVNDWVEVCVEQWQMVYVYGPEGELIYTGEPTLVGIDCTTWYQPDNPNDNDPTPPDDVPGGGGSSGGNDGNGDNGNTWSPDLEILSPTPQTRVISNIAQFLECIDKTKPAVLNIYVDQPTYNSTATWSGAPTSPDVGHTFISIEQNGIEKVFGFYPSQGVNPITAPSTSSVLVNDGDHHYDVKLTANPISPAHLTDVINYVTNYPSVYNLNTANCSNFGINVAAEAGIILPQTTGTWPGGSGCNPGNLGQDIRAMNNSSNITITKTQGTAVSSTNCN